MDEIKRFEIRAEFDKQADDKSVHALEPYGLDEEGRYKLRFSNEYGLWLESALQSAREEIAKEIDKRKRAFHLIRCAAKRNRQLIDEADRMREALKTVANYFGVFGVKIGEKCPSFGEAGRACAEALGYSGDSYSNSKWGEPTELAPPAAPEKAESYNGYCKDCVKYKDCNFSKGPHDWCDEGKGTGKPIAEGGEG